VRLCIFTMLREALFLGCFFLVVLYVYADTDGGTCQNIGRLSGCSGCEGSAGMCRYVGRKHKQGGKTVINYGCYSAPTAAGLTSKGAQFFYAGGLCPADADEGPVKTDATTGDGDSARRAVLGPPIGAKKASTIYSKSVKSDKVKFNGNNGEQTVDRTSSTQPLGGLSGSTDRRRGVKVPADVDPLTCENFNSRHKKTAVDFFDGCNLGYGAAAGGLSPAQRYCKSLLSAIWGAVLCPRYGKPFSGFRQHLVDKVVFLCGQAGCNPTWPWDYFIDDEIAVPDGTAFGIDSVDELGVEDMTGFFEFVCCLMRL
jgi:hypothetical protein